MQINLANMGNVLGSCTSLPRDKRSQPFQYISPLLTSFNERASFLSSRRRRRKARVGRKSLDQVVVNPLARSSSCVLPSDHRYCSESNGRDVGGLPRSSSSGQPSRSAHHNQEWKDGDDSVETKHLVMVHGGGFGAWCWYKTITLLEESGGFVVDAVDLAGSGVDSSDANFITSLAQYVKPLVVLLDGLNERDQVILVGHDLGGACISYIMEQFPSKIAKAVFVAATMLSNEQSVFDLFNQQTSRGCLMIKKPHIFLYANGMDHQPTAIDLDKSLLRDYLFNRTPAKDVALASVSMRPMPLAPVLEKLTLTRKRYGSIPRFYIKTREDQAIPVAIQEEMIRLDPPQQVFQLKGSDHAPFFSKPRALHRILLQIFRIPQTSLNTSYIHDI